MSTTSRPCALATCRYCASCSACRTSRCGCSVSVVPVRAGGDADGSDGAGVAHAVDGFVGFLHDALDILVPKARATGAFTVVNTVYDFQTLVTERLIDYVRAAVTHAGGVTHLKKIADFAAIYGIKTGFHGPTDVSPVGQAAHLHLDLALHNFGIQEYMRHSDQTLEVFRTSLRFEDGLLHPPRRAFLRRPRPCR